MTRPQSTHTVLLGVLACLCIVLTIVVKHGMAPQIEVARRDLQSRALLAVLPADSYDNHPLESPLNLSDTDPDSTVRAGYLASRAGQPTAVVFLSLAKGYAGPIELLIGVSMDGRLTGVKVASQQESPGLGDKIVTEPQWLQDFTGKALSQPPEPSWALKKDNGQFDQLSGATITSRSVVEAIRATLHYFDEHKRLINSATGSRP